MTTLPDSREMHPQRWGDPAEAGPLPESARGLVELAFGVRDRRAVEEVTLPPSTLPRAVLDELTAVVGAGQVLTDDDTRRLRTRGKSTPDLLLARAGDLSDAPDAVVRPDGSDQVAAVLDVAARHRLAVVPFGGGTAVTGGLVAAREGFAGVLSLDLVRMKRLLAVDPVSMTATLEPGLRGPEAEALLAEHGLTIGHFPQSFEYASLGGFAATRSSGQSSAGYGRFDSLVVGLTLVTPTGVLRLGTAPASAETVTVTLVEENDQLTVTIADDGIGFEPASKRRHFGLETMRERAEIAGGSLAVHSIPAGGTRVTLRLPLLRD